MPVVLAAIASWRKECGGRNTPLIWAADPSAAQFLSRALLREEADGLGSRTWEDNGEGEVLGSTCGAITMGSRGRDVSNTLLLVFGQIGCYRVMREYGPSLESASSLSVFVVAAPIYGMFAMLQSHVNRVDRYQQLVLISGLVTALWICASTSPSVRTFAATSSVELAASACGHCVWRILFNIVIKFAEIA
ncbi:hypothetical protein EJ02DRAFT_510289 [Clathrospora elynae]|uniref:Uncharacterized protein n=1 Tax=Clathrospora elynae TaxID=706981 RepID=A0A6A5SWV9_9PLEO|nr:hypothetical protein EJ02DRAFT_510289 [Clathrospora elynae]